MSKVLKISKHKLDLAQVALTGPSLLIGRSPLCDQVLRAPGIKPVHFLLEWIGEGEFNPNEGMWTLFDMGRLLSGTGNGLPDEGALSDLTGEGVIIDGQQYLGYNWNIVEDRMKATHLQRRIISSQLMASTKSEEKTGTQFALEIVCLSKKEQKVQEIWHFFNQVIDPGQEKRELPFQIHWATNDEASFTFTEKPQSIYNLRGHLMEHDGVLKLSPRETHIVHFEESIYFIRFVNRVEFESVAFNFFQHRFWLSIALSLIIFCLTLVIIKQINFTPEVAEEKPELRVVKVVETEKSRAQEKMEPEPYPGEIPQPMPLPTTAAPQDEVVDKAKLPRPMAETVPTKKQEKSEGAPVQSNFKTEPGEVKTGLNSPAKVSNVNTVGLLGKLKGQRRGRTSQITAETISQTYADNTASADDHQGIAVATPKMGILAAAAKAGEAGSGKTGDVNLMEAKTTLRGAKDIGHGSGPLARAGGLKNSYSIGSDGSVGGIGGGQGQGTKFGDGNAAANLSDYGDVSGGLTKAQVSTVINAHRRQIRTCFESALRMRNDLNGILRLRFVINLAGTVNEIKVVNTELESGILESCVFQVIRQMKFPESPNHLSTTVIYPFFFKRS